MTKLINKKVFFTIFIVSCTISLLFPIQYASAENTEDIAMKENETYTYVLEKIDAEKYALYVNDFNYLPAFFAYEYFPHEGMTYKYTIEHIEEGLNFWYVETEILIYKDDQNVEPVEGSISIPKYIEDYNKGFGFIPINAKEFLEDWVDFTLDENYELKGTTLKYKDEDHDLEETFIYQENGILTSTVIEIDGDVIYKFILNPEIISMGLYFCGFLMISLIGMIFVIKRKIRRDL